MKNRYWLLLTSLMGLLWFLSMATRPAPVTAAPATNPQHAPADGAYQIYLPLVAVALPQWQPQTPPLSTPWTAAVSPSNARPEYPRPQFVRSRWLNLNGVWQFQNAVEGEAPPVGQILKEAILVPFPIESALSGIMRYQDRMWYRRTFTVPAEWAGERVMLNFDAVDWETTVYVNGSLVGSHRGGYDAFSLDITDRLNGGTNELIVNVYDPTNNGNQPMGKQRLYGTGIWYTSASGIWQTVWLEPVPTASITHLQITPDIDRQTVQLLITGQGITNHTIEARVRDASAFVAGAIGNVGSPITISIPAPHLWSPDDHFLYNLQIDLKLGSTVVDHIDSYFGMRKISIQRLGNYMRLMLNNQFVFQMGVMDQGYWPDGIYTAPTDEALRFDLEQAKALGYNLIRMHMKVEAPRWYYWADKLGLLVWQDMPAMRDNSPTSPSDRAQFEVELKAMIDGRRNSPAIVMWILFNEGWGQFDGVRLTSLVKSWDPSRLVDTAGGWREEWTGDVIDHHTYVNPEAPLAQVDRASVVGEFGGIGLKIPGHTWGIQGYAYAWQKSGAALQTRYLSIFLGLQGSKNIPGLSAAVYTQLFDVEGERNGWFTYDRAVLKVDAAALRAAHQNLITAPVVP